MKKILVIKHGSLGDIIFALTPMYIIRQNYKDSSIHLITENKYCSFLSKSNFFNKIIIDKRKNFFLHSLLTIFKLAFSKYDLVIDLQNSQRSNIYNFIFRFLGKSSICGSRFFANYRYYIPEQGKESATNGLLNQLKLIGINKFVSPSYNWLKVNIEDNFNKPLALFIPGVSKGNEYKQWQPEKFAEIAEYAENKNYLICVVGTNADLISVNPILQKCTNIINKIDLSPPEVVYSIALKSKLILTNDTGPGHIAALSNNNTLWIANENSVTKANILNTKNSYKISKKSLKHISSKEVISFIEKKQLL